MVTDLVHVTVLPLVLLRIPASFDCSGLESAWKDRMQLEKEMTEGTRLASTVRDRAEAHELRRANDALYASYISHVFFHDGDLCTTEDPIVQVCNAYARARRGTMSFEPITRVLLEQGDRARALWEMDEIMMSQPSLYGRWYAKYGDSPGFAVIEGIVSSLKHGRQETVDCFLMLLDGADGMYGEWMVEELVDLMKQEPRFMLSRLFRYKKARHFVRDAVVLVC